MTEATAVESSSRVAIVTGAARGIGRATAIRLAEKGVNVVVNYQSNEAAANETVQIASGKGVQAVAVAADVSKPEDARRLVETAIARFGKVDILVNNAGITRDQLLVRMSDDDWDAVLDTNLKGAFMCTRAALRSMIRQRWGRIVNISSIAGVMGNPGQANYSAAKGGLIALTRTTAREVASRRITVNAIAPGFIETDMTRKLGEGRQDELLKMIPLGYCGKPEDIANVVAFLASDEAHYITGQVLNVDGGAVMG